VAVAGILATSAYMVVINVAQPIALQSDRIVLSWRSTTDELARYSLIAQLYQPLLGCIFAVGATLWPYYARRRAEGVIAPRDVWRPVAAFGLLGAVCGGLLVGVGPLLARLVGGDVIDVSVSDMAPWALLVLVQGATIPLGMLLTDPAGLRYQAIALSVMMIVNLPASWALAEGLGAAGPVLCSAATIFVCQTVPCALRARWLTGRPAAGASA